MSRQIKQGILIKKLFIKLLTGLISKAGSKAPEGKELDVHAKMKAS